MATWHGLIGPAEFILPDEEDHIEELFATQAGLMIGTYAANRYATFLEYRLVRHKATGNLVRREIMRQGIKKTSQATIWRGLGLAAVANPFVGFLVGATMMAYSIPPSGNPRGNILPGDIRYLHIPEE